MSYKKLVLLSLALIPATVAAAYAQGAQSRVMTERLVIDQWLQSGVQNAAPPAAVQALAPVTAPAPSPAMPPVVETAAQETASAQMPPSAAAVPPETGTVLQLDEALSYAYQYNPDLAAARAELRSVDETYAQAFSGYRPVVTGDASYVSSYHNGDAENSDSDPKTLSVGLLQPLYRGGTTSAEVKASENRIKAQRALLVAAEQNVLLGVATAYMNVLRDQKLVELTSFNERVLASHLDAVRQRFELGDITKTDVSQSEARLANATAGRVAAESDYHASRAEFERVVGLTPERLQSPVGSPGSPATLDEAVAAALQDNPDIVYARYASAEAQDTTRAIKGELLPQVNLNGSVGRTYDPSQRLDSRVDSTTIGVLATIPLYSGGGVDSRVRQSRQIEAQRRLEVNSAEKTVRQRVVDAWTALVSARAETEARAAQINAAALALEGVRVETDYGSRTTLDLLDAQQEYLDALVAHVVTERNTIVASYGVLATMGRLTAQGLKLQVKPYDQATNFQKVNTKWIGTDID